MYVRSVSKVSKSPGHLPVTRSPARHSVTCPSFGHLPVTRSPARHSVTCPSRHSVTCLLLGHLPVSSLDHWVLESGSVVHYVKGHFRKNNFITSVFLLLASQVDVRSDPCLATGIASCTRYLELGFVQDPLCQRNGKVCKLIN